MFCLVTSATSIVDQSGDISNGISKLTKYSRFYLIKSAVSLEIPLLYLDQRSLNNGTLVPQ